MNTMTRGADQILTSISKKLASGQLKTGDKLPAEAKLCEEYHVSRTVVREAIQQLKAIGVVKTITGSGSYITKGDLDGLKNSLEFYSTMTADKDSWVDMLEMRILIESSCARNLASDRFSNKNLSILKNALLVMQNNIDSDSDFYKYDVDFHKKLIAAAGNKIYAAILTSLENLLLRFAKEAYEDDSSPNPNQKNYDEHKLIVDAIEDRNPDMAEEAMKNHLSTTLENLQVYIKNHREYA